MIKLNHKILLARLPFIASSHYICASGGNANDPFTIEATDKENKAEIKIVGYIGEWDRASSRDLETKVDALIAKGYNDAHIYINSKGGSTIEAVEIMNILRRFKGKLIAYGGSIVASAAGYIACECDEFRVAPNTQFMYHRPTGYFSGNFDEITSSLALLQNTEKDYIRTLSSKSKYSAKEIVANWTKGDQWLMGKEIVKDGFADKVMKKDVAISAKDVAMIEACGAPVVPKITVKSLNKNIVDKLELITALGLDANATDAEITAAVQKNKTDAKAFADGKAKREADAKVDADTKVNALVDDAIKAKKITADQKENYTILAKVNFEVTKATLDAMQVLEKPNPSDGGSSTEASQKDWSLKDYQEKDPEAFIALMDSDPEKADRLENEHYK